MEEMEDLEIGIPRQVISLKSSSRSLRLFSCVLFLHNIIFISHYVTCRYTKTSRLRKHTERFYLFAPNVIQNIVLTSQDKLLRL